MIRYPELRRPDCYQVLDEDLIAHIGATPHLITPDKALAPLFGPYTFGGTPTGRNNESVATVDYLVLDFDGPKGASGEHEGLDPDAFAQAIGALAPFDCLLVSSYSDGQEIDGVVRVAFRAIVRLTRPIPAEDWRDFFGTAIATFPQADPNPKAVSQAYYYPSSHPDRAGKAWRLRLHGAPLNPDLLTEAAPLPEGPRGSRAPIRKEAIEGKIKAFRKSGSTQKQEIADMLACVRDGIAFAMRGNRAVATFTLVLALAELFPDASPDTIAETLRLSLEIQGAPSVGEIPAMVGRARRIVRERSEQPIAQSDLSTQQLRSIFQTDNDPLRCLIVQHHTDYWLASYAPADGLQYHPTTKDAVLANAKEKLGFAKVPLVELLPNGARRFKPDELVDRYGTAVDRVTKSFVIHVPEIRKISGCRDLALPVASVGLDPEYHVEVDQWLRMMGGDTLLDWIGLAADPSRPLTILFVLGRAATGKSFLAKQLARIWTEYGPPKLNNALAAFNDEMLRAPFLFSDEDIPRDHKGRVRTAELRDLIQTEHHAINAKHRHMSFLEGFPRVMVAANNDNVLAFGGDSLTAEDLEALRQRSTVIRVPASCAEFLERHDTKAWVTSKAIPRHALWLAANRDLPEHRFGLAPTSDIAFSLNGSLHLSCLEWIVRHIFGPGRIAHATAVNNDFGFVRVHMRDLDAHWGTYLETPKPRLTAISNAVSKYRDSDGGWIKVPFNVLFAWCAQANYCTQSELARALGSFVGAPKLKAV
jgi:hypothetical protein